MVDSDVFLTLQQFTVQKELFTTALFLRCSQLCGDRLQQAAVIQKIVCKHACFFAEAAKGVRGKAKGFSPIGCAQRTRGAAPPRRKALHLNAANAAHDLKKRIKKALSRVRNKSALKKISGTVLLSHSRFYSTIAAGVLNYRVREGNVCCYPAMSTGKKIQ